MGREVGFGYEQKARAFLLRQGYCEVACNVQSRYGEIDLIVEDEATKELVFVEVKARAGVAPWHGVESVHVAKQRRIIATAEFFLQQLGYQHNSYRFDVVVINREDERITWIKEAFCCDRYLGPE